MAQIGIIGSGNVGANTAFFAAEKNFAHVRMYDVKEGLSTGKALDMMEAAPLRGYQYRLSGTDELADVLDSDVVVVAAGETREPGMKREDLYEKNKPIFEEIAGKLKGYGGVVIVATEPVDLFTLLLVREGLPWQRVMGVGGALDSARLQVLIARELFVAQEDVKATVIGRHSEEMIALPAYCSVAGVPVTKLVSETRFSELVRTTVDAGDHIVALATRTNSFYGPAAAAADLAEAVIRGTNRIMPVSLVFSGQYGISDVAMSLPALVGGAGIERVLEPKLTDGERVRLEQSAESLKAFA
ncbi:MAG: malate dehydrogenase [Spirochaetota bacterium]